MGFLDKIKLSFSNNLVIASIPEAIGLSGLSKIHEKETSIELESFGLFERATPNYTQYYPDVSAEDLQPKEEEFIQPTFRALSEVIVHKRWNPIDFSMNGVLKKSITLLKGQTIYADHETALGNALGAVADVFWENSYKTKNGVIVPAGINARLKIDGKSNPRIARAVMMDPPSIHSTSVTVEFEWEKSHDLPADEFFALIGTKHKDGSLIRRVASTVRQYHEISLVGHGADPFAQKTGEDGEIVNPKYAKIAYNKETNEAKYPKFYSFSFKEDLVENEEVENTIPVKTNDIVTENNQETNSLNMKELLVALAAILCLETPEGEDPTKEAVLAGLNKLKKAEKDATDQIAALETRITELTAVETEYNEKKPLLENVEKLNAFQTEYIENTRAEVTRLYGIISQGKPMESITKMIATLGKDGLEALKMTYQQQVEKEYPATCSDCGSHNVSRASVEMSDPETKPDAPKKEKDSYDAAEEIRKKKRGNVTSKIHPVED